MPYLRLRQVCLVAADLAREAEKFKAALGLQECYRDTNVAKYGLEKIVREHPDEWLWIHNRWRTRPEDVKP